MSNTLPQDWKQVILGDLGRVVTGRTPPSSKPELFGDQYPFITPTDIGFSDRSILPERGISDAGAESLSRIKLPAKTPCFVCIGATIGKLCLTSEESFTNQQINSIVVDKERHNPEFVYYLLRHISEQVKSLAGGAATPIINKTAFSKVPVLVPPLKVQESIASILSAYDDIIENNTRRIEILEEMSRRLYEEWFVHFRFPGHEEVSFKESELGRIPEGWEVRSIQDLCSTINSGSTPPRKSSEFWEAGTICWYKTRELWDGFLFESEERVTEKAVEKKKARVFYPGTILMAIYGSPTVGRLGIVTERSSSNQAALGMVPNKDLVSFWVFYFNLWTLREDFNSLAQGAAQQNISKEKVAKSLMLVPSLSLREKFEAVVSSMKEQAKLLQRENTNLCAQRDLLLPKLVSGEIDVSAIPMPDDKEVEAA